MLKVDKDGYLYKKLLTDGRQGVVMPMLFGKARIGVGPKDADWFDDNW